MDLKMVRPDVAQRRRSDRGSEMTVTERKYRNAKRSRNTCIYILTGMCSIFAVLTVLLAFLLYLTSRRLIQLDPNLSFLISNSTFQNYSDATATTPMYHHDLYTKPDYTQPTIEDVSKKHPEPPTVPGHCERFRLSPFIVPFKYDITLNMDLDTANFKGKTSILVNVSEPVREIRVHGKYLVFQNVEVLELTDVGNSSVGTSNSKRLSVDSFNENRDCEMWNINFKTELKPGVYELIIVFASKPDKPKMIVGLYRSKYVVDKFGNQSAIATSKFEPTYARLAFPCFDEPGMKAKYVVRLIRPTNKYVALSNMDIVSEEKYSDNQTIVLFRESVPMSTYLVCFIVCDFDFTETTIQPPANLGTKFPFRVYATPQQKSKTNFALDFGAKTLTNYINFFEVEYPLPKLDMIAIPDFPSGAMETWGLITYRETALLYDSVSSSVANLERVAQVIAHELTHMWFGNLVTMKWWNELWLNEGFAKYIEYLGVDMVYKDWQMENKFVKNELQRALEADSKKSSHPIIVTVENPDQITSVFDSISYSKGGSILRMLRNYVTPEVFRKGISSYLKKFVYKNADSDDLFKTIQAVYGKDGDDLVGMMHTWIQQMNYPEVAVQSLGNGVYELTQSRFLSGSAENTTDITSPFGYKWTIPISYITSKNPETKFQLFKHTESKLTIQIPDGNELKWIKFNVGTNGFYRVNYDNATWKTLIDNFANFSIADQIGLMDDAFSLAWANRLPYKTALNLTKQMKTQNETIPWQVTTKHLCNLRDMVENTETFDIFGKYVLNITGPILEQIGWDISPNETNLERQRRVNILSTACYFGNSKCLEEAGTRLKQFIGDETKMPHNDLRTLVLRYGMIQIGNAEIWDKLWERYLKTEDAQVKETYRSGLAAIRDPEIIQKFIKLAWNPDYVRRQDYFTVLSLLSDNPVGTQIVWDYVRNNFDDLVKEFTLNDRILGQTLYRVTVTFKTEERLKEVQEFYDKHGYMGAGETPKKKALEEIPNRIKWIKTHLNEIHDWCKNN